MVLKAAIAQLAKLIGETLFLHSVENGSDKIVAAFKDKDTVCQQLAEAILTAWEKTTEEFGWENDSETVVNTLNENPDLVTLQNLIIVPGFRNIIEKVLPTQGTYPEHAQFFYDAFYSIVAGNTVLINLLLNKKIDEGFKEIGYCLQPISEAVARFIAGQQHPTYLLDQPESDPKIKKLYALSIPSLKKMCAKALKLQALDPENPESLVPLILSVQEQPETWDYISDLFKYFINYQYSEKDRPNEETNINIQGNCFEFIANDLINEVSKEQNRKTPNWLILGSQPAQGKSSFLSFEYVYLLSRLNELGYIPLYLNLEIYTPDPSDTESAAAVERKAAAQISQFFEKAETLKKEFGLPALFIIDGLCDCEYYGRYSLEKVILKQMKDTCREKDSWILAFDGVTHPNYEKPEIAKDKYAARRMYLRPLKTFYQKDELDPFLEAYSKVFSSQENRILPENIRKAITALDVDEIDLNFLIHLIDARPGDDIKSYKDLVKPYLNELFASMDDADMLKIRHAAFHIWYGGYTYFELKNHESCGISVGTFEVLRKQLLPSYYLIAEYYIDQIKTFAEETLTIPEGRDSVFSHFFDSTQTKILNDCFKDPENISEKTLAKFQQTNYRNLPLMGKSQFIHLVRKANKPKNAEFNTLTVSGNPADLFFYQITNRTIKVEECRINYKKTEEYIKYLIKNKEARLINTLVNLLYYADLPDVTAALELFNDGIKNNYRLKLMKGFTGFKTYYVLKNRVDAALTALQRHPHAQANEWLFVLDLFTLCDLIEQQLHSRTYSDNEAENPSFFYNQAYVASKSIRPRKVIDDTISLIDRTFERKNLHLSPLLLDYLSVCRSEFSEVKEFFRKNEKKPLETTFFADNESFRQISGLTEKTRIRWTIADTSGDKKKYAVLQEQTQTQPMRESVAGHIYNTYILGLLYLPETATDADYNKQTVLNMILIHDIGESVVGDCPRCAADREKIKEAEDFTVRKFFLQGAINNDEDLLPYYELWDEWKNGETVNAKIAKDLDVIQSLYEYYVLTERGVLKFTDARKEEITNMIYEIRMDITRKIADAILPSDM